jgi:hypothetical protein
LFLIGFPLKEVLFVGIIQEVEFTFLSFGHHRFSMFCRCDGSRSNLRQLGSRWLVGF